MQLQNISKKLGRRRKGGIKASLNKPAIPAEKQEAIKKSPIESVNLVDASISTEIKEINQRVNNLTAGVKHLHSLFAQSKTEHVKFYEANREKYEAFINTDLDSSYQKLVKAVGIRKKFFDSLLQNQVISKTDLALLCDQPEQPYEEAIDAIKAHKAAAQELTEEDVRNLKNADTDNFQTLLTELKNANKLTDDQVNQLTQVGPKSAQETKQAKDQVWIKIHQYDIAHGTENQAKFTQIKDQVNEAQTETSDLLDQFRTYKEDLVAKIQEMYDQEEYKQKKKDALAYLSDASGLPIKAGTVLYCEDLRINEDDSSPRTRDKKVEILKIGFGETQIDAAEDTEYQGSMPSFEPVVHFKVQVDDQHFLEKHLSGPNFLQWLKVNNVAQKIDNLNDLEKELDLVGELKVGKVFHFPDDNLAPTAEGNNTVTEKTVKIEAIDQDGITLDQEVILDQIGYKKNRQAKKLSFGDFARWFRKTDVLPNVDTLDQLNKQLLRHHQLLQLELEMELPNPPIDLKKAKPIPLHSAYYIDQPVQEIIAADDQKITMADGRTFTPDQFLREVYENGLLIPTVEDLQKLKDLDKNKKGGGQEKQFHDLITKYSQPAAAATALSNVKAEKEAGKLRAHKKSYLKSLWEKTYFLSLLDIYELFIKTPIEKIKEKLKDKQERRVAQVGRRVYRGVPYIGKDLVNKFTAVVNSKTAEDVKKQKDIWENEAKTTIELYGLLYKAPNRIHFKAALELLAAKGVLRFDDDRKLHDKINALFPNHKYKESERFPEEIKNQIVVVGERPKNYTDPITPKDQIRIILDNEFGEGTLDSIDRTNNGEYDNRKTSSNKAWRKIDAAGGGIFPKISNILQNFQEGRDFDSAEFEGYLQGIVNSHDWGAQQSILFFISAFGARRKGSDQSLIPIEKIDEFIGEFQSIPMFTYFALSQELHDEQGNLLYDDQGKPKKGKMTINDFRLLYRQVIQKDIDYNKAINNPKGLYEAKFNTIEWIQANICTNQKILDKNYDSFGNVDKQYYNFLGPTLYENKAIQRVVESNWNTTKENYYGLKNMFVGYNSNLKTRSNRLRGVPPNKPEERKIRSKQLGDTLSGFLYFDYALQGKLGKINETFEQRRYIKFEKHWDERAGCDDRFTVWEFTENTREFTKKFIPGLARLNGDMALANEAADFFSRSPLEYEELEAFQTRVYNAIQLAQVNNYEALCDLSESCAASLKGMIGQTALQVKEEE